MALDGSESPKLAVIVLLGTVMALSFGDALVRKMGLAAGDPMSLWQVFFVRSGLALVVLVLIVSWLGTLRDLRPDRWTVLRSAMLVVMWLLYYVALLHVPLSVGAAAFYTSPLFILLFSARITGDRIGGLGVLGVVFGFLGVLVMTNPTDGLNLWAILPLGAAVLYALSMILTRTRCLRSGVLSLAFWLNITFVIVGGLGMVLLPDGPDGVLLQSTWISMSSAAWATIVVSAVVMLIGSLGTAFAYQRASGPLLGTFDFSYLAFAILWGWLIFDERISLQTTIGVGMIVFAGILALVSGKRTAGPVSGSKA